jgi:hypothetical protein
MSIQKVENARGSKKYKTLHTEEKQRLQITLLEGSSGKFYGQGTF